MAEVEAMVVDPPIEKTTNEEKIVPSNVEVGNANTDTTSPSSNTTGNTDTTAPSSNTNGNNANGGGADSVKQRTSEERKSSGDKKRDEKSKDDRGRSERSKRRASTRRSRSRDKRPRRQKSPDIRAPSAKRVYLANVPYDARWQDIKDLFREKIGDCEFIHLFEDEEGKPRGCGLVEFKDPASVQKALDVMHKFDYKGRKFVVKEDYDSERDRFGRIVKTSGKRSVSPSRSQSREPRRDRERHDSRNRDSSGVSRWVNTYGLSPQFLESLGITGPITNSVFVANLDYKVSSRKLREVFRMAGRVVSVNLNTDKDGSSRGHGVVTFEHPVEAVQAVSMFNGQCLNDRPLSVKIDRYAEEPDTPSSKLPSGLKGIGMGLGAGGQPLTNITTALSSMEREPIGQWGGMGAGEFDNIPDRGNGYPDRLGSGAMESLGGSHPDRSNFSFQGRSSGFGDRDVGALDRMSGAAADFADRGGFSERGGIGGGFMDRPSNVPSSRVYSDRNLPASGASGFSDTPSSMMNERGGVGGRHYPDRGASMDSGYHDRGSSSGGVSSFPERTSGGGVFNVNSFGERGGQYSTRGNVAAGSGYADRSTSAAGTSGLAYPDRKISSSGVGPVGVGLSESPAMNSGRYEELRREYSRREFASAPPENDYRNVDDSFTRQNSQASLQSSVYVRNLPKGFTRMDLIDRFCDAGNIEFAKMSNDGLGIVCFSTAREAQRSIQLFHGSRIDGRVIEVST